MLDQRFDPAGAEGRIYRAWEEAGCFRPSGDTSAAAYAIVIPPPNVTGVLHMGHALNNTLQDVLVRFERMRGKNVRWQPGTDHAGIATQMVVERQLAAAGGNEDRRSLGREEFLKRVWAWKEESGGAITAQLKRLGASCDWDNERFTMDEGLSKAVTKVFVDLYNKGLIYRAKRLVNWDPHFQSAISDLEVEMREVDGHYWHLRYPLADGMTYDHPLKDEDGNTSHETRDYIVVATSRPETMLGDTGVAVHPEDDRYRLLIGKDVILPITGRRIPIIADEYANPEKGSGAVKITPAHDFNDFEAGKRAGHTPLNILTAVAAIVSGSEADAAAIPGAFRGIGRFEAREKVIAAFEAHGLMHRIEKLKIEQPFGDRSGVVIEPWLTDQWYVDAETLAKPAREAVQEGRTRFVPATWEKTYFNWMDNIQPWCISRQLWWGHRIPAWFDQEGNIFVAATEAEARKLSGTHTELRQDEDVLDTWFSSALWPFSTQGWPDETEALKTFYPTSVLVTAFDIIFFWVARMMMMGIEFTGTVPFRDVYIHALVLDEKGQKMSKTKGNVIDPLDLIDEFGADALRFTMAAMAAQGRNLRLSKPRVEGYRNFATKLWNAARFAEMNECGAPGSLDPAGIALPVNRWMLSELSACAAEVTRGLEEYRFNDAAGALYRFIWNILCDWYLELIKPLLGGMDDAAKAETRNVCGHVIDETLKLLHPFMPFLTEELWERRSPGRTAEQGFLMLQGWPGGPGFVDEAAQKEISWLIDLVSEIRSLRSDLNVPAGAKVPFTLVNPDDFTAALADVHGDVIARLARLGSIERADEAPKGAVSSIAGATAFALSIADLIDITAEKARLDKRLADLAKESAGISGRLGNPNFVERAPIEIVEEQRERLAELGAATGKLAFARQRLDALG